MRAAFATVPVTVEYSITSLGRSLAETVGRLFAWAADHAGDVLAARAAHDRADRDKAG